MTTIWADHLFDGERLRHEEVELVASDGLIVRLEPLQRAGSKAPSQVFDARGSLVLPGLVNSHVHIVRGGVFEPNERISGSQAKRNLAGSLAAGVTTVGDMACSAPLIARLREHVRKNPHAGPSIRAAGPIVTAPRGYPLDWMPPLFAKLGLALPCGDEPAAQRAAQTVASEGMDHVKLAIMHQSYSDTPLPAVSIEVARALVKEAHRLGLRVLAHAHSTADYDVALGAGVDALMHSSFEPLSAELVARVRDAGIYVCPTLWAFESVCLGSELRLDRDPRYTKHVASYVQRSWRKFAEAYAESGDVVPDAIAVGVEKTRSKEAIRVAAANLALLRDAGVPIAFGNDASYGFSLVARPVDELAAMQRAGMDALACLKSATSGAAALLHCKDRGELCVGKRADLVVADLEAARDITALEAPRAVFVAGERVEPLGVLEGAKLSLEYWRGVADTALPLSWRKATRA